MTLAYANPRLRNLYYRSPTVFKETMALVYSLRQRPNRFGGVFAEQLAELQLNEYNSAEWKSADQFDRLQRMLVFAETRVPYYQRLFRSIGFDAASLQSIEDLKRLPLLDKETVRAQRDELRAQSDVGRTLTTHTSGTTGKSLQLVVTQEATQRYYAWWWYHYGWAGIKRSEPVATFWGQPVADPNSLRPPFWVRDRLENELLFSSQHLTPDTLPLYADALADFKPALLRGYPSSLYVLALYLLEGGRKDIRPKAVFPSSETIFDFQRKAIEQAFGCQAYSYYGNAERVAQLLQCQNGNYHVASETCVVEVLKPDGSPAAEGELGELVCTGLLNRAMPLIRYRIGDTAIAANGHCTCGRNTPILKSLTGRAEDIVVTPDGRHVGRLDHAFKDTVSVKEAQIVQEDVESILVKIVPRNGFGSEEEQQIRDELRLRLGHGIKIQLQLVDRIPRMATGKFRFVISKVPIQIGRALVDSDLIGRQGNDRPTLETLVQK